MAVIAGYRDRRLKIFGIEITTQGREDVLFVFAISLLLLGALEMISRSFDTAGYTYRMERLEQRVFELERQNDDES